MKARLKQLYGKIFAAPPRDCRGDFGTEVTRRNVSAGRLLAICTMLIAAAVLAALVFGGMQPRRDKLTFIVVYVFILLFAAGMTALFSLLQKRLPRYGRASSALCHAHAWIIMAMSATLTLTDYTLFPDSLTYVVSILAAAVCLLTDIRRLLAMYISVHIPFCAVFAALQPGAAVARVVETSALVALCLLISHIFYQNCIREFSHKMGMRKSNLELKGANARLAEQAVTDPLTGVGNRRRFEQVLESEYSRCERHGLCLSVMMIDIDHFKRYNDIYGHQAGDDCLRRVAGAISSCLRRQTDFTARYGGEEFVVVLPHMDASRTLMLAEKIRLTVEDMAVPHEGSLVAPVLTVSIGVYSTVPTREITAHDFVERADRALYKAKRISRNKVSAF